VVIDGGNSYYIDEFAAPKNSAKGIHYCDVDQRGVWGLERGYCQMIGGEPPFVKHLDPIFKTLAPGRGNVDRTPGRDKVPGTAEEGTFTVVPLAPAISSRWSTTASNTD